MYILYMCINVIAFEVVIFSYYCSIIKKAILYKALLFLAHEIS